MLPQLCWPIILLRIITYCRVAQIGGSRESISIRCTSGSQFSVWKSLILIAKLYLKLIIRISQTPLIYKKWLLHEIKALWITILRNHIEHFQPQADLLSFINREQENITGKDNLLALERYRYRNHSSWKIMTRWSFIKNMAAEGLGRHKVLGQ